MILETRIPLRYLLGIAKRDLIIVSLFTFILAAISETYHITYEIPFSIPAFLGTAISLLLSFKLSHSYERWWEARKIWGAIVNDSRSLVLQLKQFCVHEDHPLIKVIGNRQIAWCYALTDYLRKTKDHNQLEKYIAAAELNKLKASQHMPLELLDRHAADLRTLQNEQEINSFQQMQLDSTLVRLCQSMGQAERIKNTVFPKLYRLFLKMFIYLFVVILAIALEELRYYYEVPLLILITMSFLLLEKTALILQDPFENKPNDTPMSSISKSIEININDLLGQPSSVQSPSESESFFVS